MLRSPAVTSAAEPPEAIHARLAYRAPYDVGALLRFLSLRAIPDVEQVDLGLRRVRRLVRAGTLADAPGWLEVRFDHDAPVVHLRFAPALAHGSDRVVAAVRRWLDLDADPRAIDAALAGLPGRPGLRLPGSIDPFELAVRAILGQQVTVAAARTIARRLVDRHGEPVALPWVADLRRAAPAPALLAATPVERIAELGVIRQRAAAIVAIAQAWPALQALLGPATLGGPAIDALIARLREVPGVGPWTAHYIAMRAVGWADAFPPNDVAVLKAMRALFGTASQREAERQAQAWQPWRAYAVLRLWSWVPAAAT